MCHFMKVYYYYYYLFTMNTNHCYDILSMDITKYKWKIHITRDEWRINVLRISLNVTKERYELNDGISLNVTKF